MAFDFRRRAALAIYLCQVGSRLAMVAGAPLAAAVTAGVLQDPAGATRTLALSVFGPVPARGAGLAPGIVGVAMAVLARVFSRRAIVP